MENNICDDDHQIGILAQDVLIEILVLLPVISLLRFKSVCKSWRALIQSPLFVHLHLNTTTTTTTLLLRPSNNNNNNNFGTFIFQTLKCTDESRKNDAFMLSGGGGGGGEKDDNVEEEEEELKMEYLGFPPHCKVSPGHGLPQIFMVGSCNGLICIHDIKQREVSLWNPATRQFRLLPKSLTLEGIGNFLDYDFAAFGYDVKTKDYKVVQISHFIPYYMRNSNRLLNINELIFRVQVYSLNTDSWRLLEGIDYLPAVPEYGSTLNHGVYLNGSYYFLGSYYAEYEIEPHLIVTPGIMLLSFDFTKEIFTNMQLPHGYQSSTILTCFGEKLALFTKVESNLEFYDIWVLNEQEESWTNLHLTVPFSFGRTPRCISNSGEFALLATFSRYGGELLQLFNIVTKEIQKELPISNKVLRADVYKQSLVSIGGNDTVADRVIGGTM